MRAYSFRGITAARGREDIHGDEFLWGGLRTRLERMGRVRPRTIGQAAVGQQPEPVHAQVRFRPVQPALRPAGRGAGAGAPLVVASGAQEASVKGGGMADTETPVLDLLGKMTADSIEASSLDAEALVLTRIAALVAVDAPPASYMLNLGAASEIGIDADRIRGVLAAIAPIVGTARIVAATGNIARALGIALELAELEAEIEGDSV
jgi:hypothetical protein